MECIAPSAKTWRDELPDYDDDIVEEELEYAWGRNEYRKIDPQRDPDKSLHYHDWANYRSATLREARKRGLDISITGLGT